MAIFESLVNAAARARETDRVARARQARLKRRAIMSRKRPRGHGNDGANDRNRDRRTIAAPARKKPRAPRQVPCTRDTAGAAARVLRALEAAFDCHPKFWWASDDRATYPAVGETLLALFAVDAVTAEYFSGVVVDSRDDAFVVQFHDGDRFEISTDADYPTIGGTDDVVHWVRLSTLARRLGVTLAA